MINEHFSIANLMMFSWFHDEKWNLAK